MGNLFGRQEPAPLSMSISNPYNVFYNQDQQWGQYGPALTFDPNNPNKIVQIYNPRGGAGVGNQFGDVFVDTPTGSALRRIAWRGVPYTPRQKVQYRPSLQVYEGNVASKRQQFANLPIMGMRQ